MKFYGVGRVASGVLVIVLGAFSLMAAAPGYHLLKKYSFGAAEGAAREYFDFITDGAEGKVVIFDLQSLKVTGEAKADKDADSVAYDPFSKRVFVMNGDPHSSTVIDAKSGSVVGTIELGGGPEFAVADGYGTVYVNLEDKSELVAIDSRTLK